MSKTFSRLAPVRNFSLLSQKMAELSAFSFFSIPVTLYFKNSNACFGMFLKSRKKTNGINQARDNDIQNT